MPKAQVQIGNRVAEIEVPEGTTPLQVEAFVHEKMNGKQRDFTPPEAPNAGERFGRGMADVAEGLTQAKNYARDRLQGTKGDSQDTTDYTKQKTEEGQLYERGRNRGAANLSDVIAGREGDAGMDWFRLLGNIVSTAPAVAVPGGAAVKILPRVLSGAGGGAAASGSMFTPEGESKVKQTLIGAGFGAAAPVVLNGVKMAWNAGAKRMASDTMDPAKNVGLRTALEQDVQKALDAQGIDFTKLGQDVKTSLVADAAEAMKTGGTLDKAMLARKADIEAVGAKPTRAAVTRSPQDWQYEQNTRGLREGIGDPIVKRQQENAAAMTDYLGRLRVGTGGKTFGAYETGESATKALQAADTEKEKAVGKLYDAFRSSGAQDATVPTTKIADTLGKVADEIGHENIPAAVLNRLKEFGLMGEKQTKLLTVNEADKLNRLINNNNPGHGPGSLALGRIKGAVNQALLEVEPAGQQGVEALKTARAAAAQRFAEADASKGIGAAIDDVHPDQFVQKFIVKAPARDLEATLRELRKTPDGVQAVKDVKGHILDSLLLKATGSSSIDDLATKLGTPDTRFSGATFAKALDAIEPEKLHKLFSPDEIGMLRQLQRASKYLTTDVPFSDVNHSKTAGALANLLMKVGGGIGEFASGIPLIGKMAAGAYSLGDKAMKEAAAKKAVAEALLGKVPVEAGAKAALPVYQFERALPGAAAGAAQESRRD